MIQGFESLSPHHQNILGIPSSAGFRGLVAALAWNEAIKAAVASVFNTGDELLGLVVYAVIVTILAVIMTLLIARALGKAKDTLAASKKN